MFLLVPSRITHIYTYFHLKENINLPFHRKFYVWEVRREDEFSPLKNGSGTKDTATTCKRDLMLQHVRWLQAAGAILPTNIVKQIILYEEKKHHFILSVFFKTSFCL